MATEELREIQRQKWLRSKEATGESDQPAAASSQQPASSDQPTAASSHSAEEVPRPAAPAPTDGASVLEKVNILPFHDTVQSLGDRNRLEFLSPELRRRRNAGEVLRGGDVMTHEGLQFAVTHCVPAEGVLGPDTDYFLDGPPLVLIDKIQFNAWGPVEMSDERVFSEYLVPWFKEDGFATYGTPGASRVRLLHLNQTFQIKDDISLYVEAMEPAGQGVCTTQTEIFTSWDQTPDFERIHMVPFQDTLPRAYQFDVFTDYLKPYLSQNRHKKFHTGEMFSFNGVQFKVVACDPEAAVARVGRGTTIFCEGVLHPTLRDRLPPELLAQVAQLPPGLQMLLLTSERNSRELEETLSRRRGLFEETLASVPQFQWPPQDETALSQSTCVVCQNDFEQEEECRRLPCGHVFHRECIDEWLRRCTDCPICKANVDRAIRDY